jgi:hypothetical protein
VYRIRRAASDVPPGVPVPPPDRKLTGEWLDGELPLAGGVQ